MTLVRLLTCGFLAVTAAAGQAILDTPKQIADAQQLLDTFRGEAVRCEVIPLLPRLSYRLRLRSGYFWRLHLDSAQVSGRKWIVLARVTPKGGDPIYLSDVVAIPAGNEVTWEYEGGHFWLGEGHYAVQFLMFDDQGRACRQEFQIDARLNSAERKLHPLVPPHAVTAASWNVVTHTAGNVPAGAGRVTILLDVADQIRTPDQVLLLDALTALLEELPARSVRLVMFDLTQQKEVLRRDGVTSEALPEVAQAMRAVQFEAVNLSALQTPGAAGQLIENLANREMHASEPSDAVIFVGTPAIYSSKPSANFRQAAGRRLPFYYLLCPASRPPRGYASGMTDNGSPVGGAGMGRVVPPLMGPAGPGGRVPYPDSMARGRIPDAIGYAVERLGGKTLRVDSPLDFAKAVTEIAADLSLKK